MNSLPLLALVIGTFVRSEPSGVSWFLMLLACTLVCLYQHISVSK